MKKIWNKRTVLILAITASFSMAACTGGGNLPATQDPLPVTEESHQEDLTEEVLKELTTRAELFLESELQTEVITSTEEAAEGTKTGLDETATDSSKKETTTVSVTEAPTTHAPATEEVTTEVPTTETPVTEAPTTETPTTEVLATEAPVPVALSVKVKGEHYVGDSLSASDFTVTVTMSDGNTKKNPAGWTADPLYLASHVTLIMVTYQELTAQVTVNASERPTEAPTTDASIEAPTDSPIQEPVQPPMSLDRTAAETAWNIQKGIIEFQAFNLDTMDYTGKPIAWSERLYELACQRAREIVDNFSHDGFHSIDASAENIAKGVPYPDMVINGWYNSAGHKNNMLGGWNYGAIAKYGNYWVALFSNNP